MPSYRPGRATETAKAAADLAIAAFILRKRYSPQEWDRLSLVTAEQEVRRAIDNVRSAKSDMPQSYDKLLDILHMMTGGRDTKCPEPEGIKMQLALGGAAPEGAT